MVRLAWHAGHQAADAPDDQVHPHSCLGCLRQLVDQLPLRDGIDQTALSALRVFRFEGLHLYTRLILHKLCHLCNTVRFVVLNADTSLCVVKKLQHALQPAYHQIRLFHHPPVI